MGILLNWRVVGHHHIFCHCSVTFVNPILMEEKHSPRSADSVVTKVKCTQFKYYFVMSLITDVLHINVAEGSACCWPTTGYRIWRATKCSWTNWILIPNETGYRVASLLRLVRRIGTDGQLQHQVGGGVESFVINKLQKWSATEALIWHSIGVQSNACG